VVLELAGGGAGGAAGAAGAGGSGGPGEGAKKSPTIVLPTVIIDAVTIPAATSTDADGNANPGSATAAGSSNVHCIGNTSNTSNISSSSIGSNTSNHNNMSPHENNDSSQSEGMLEEGRVVTVRDLLKGLYEKACQQKLWGLVRHTAGMLGKRVEDLAKAHSNFSGLFIIQDIIFKIFLYDLKCNLKLQFL